jgi:phage terminase large subunit-like protein
MTAVAASPAAKGRPSAYAGKGLSPRRKVSGRPFTVAHFRRWSARFKLKDGSHFKLEDWEALFLKDLFARDADGLPVFAELWLVVPEGNGKTTFFALVVLYTIEHAPEAWVPVAASARDQAVDLTYRICSGFVQRNGLEETFKLHPGYRKIVHQKSQGSAKIFASDAASGDGVDPTLALIEELHRLASMDLYETWAGKLDKSHGQLVVASTAGEPGSAFEELREHIRQSAIETTREGCFVRAVASGVVLHEYAIPEDGDPEDLELVAQANPSSRITPATLARKRAKPSWRLEHWLRFTCNLPTRAGSAAVPEADWDGARTDETIPKGVPVMVGADHAWLWDCTALMPFWLRDPKFRLFGDPEILTPPRDGTMLDPNEVKAAYRRIHERNPIEAVVMDMTKAEEIAAWLVDELGVEVIDRSEGNALKALDYERFMQALGQKWLKHTGHAEFRSHVLNAVTRKVEGDRLRFDRPSQSRNAKNQKRRVIDALDAAAMVHSTATAHLTAEPPRSRWGPAERVAA